MSLKIEKYGELVHFFGTSAYQVSNANNITKLFHIEYFFAKGKLTKIACLKNITGFWRKSECEI